MASFKSPMSSTPDEVTSENGGVSFWDRIEQIQEHDREKTGLLQELLYRYEFLSQQFQQECEARNRESDAVRQWAMEKKQYEDHIMTYRIALERDPYVLVLIDADGMIFLDELIKAGDEGGRKAAGLVHAAVLNYVQRELLHVPTDIKVVCRVYANVRGLADVLVRMGVIDEVEVFEQFSRGFTRGKVLFDFVDVGSGKDRADEKIIESFKLYLADFHCRQIFFGCSHDNGYARILEDHASDQVAIERITLLEGVPFEKELVTLPFKSKKLPGIFRDTKLNINTWGTPPANIAAAGVSKNYNMIGGLPSRFPPPPSRHDSTLLDSPLPAHVMPNIPRTPSTSTLASNEGIWMPPTAKNGMNWAAKAAAPPPPQAFVDTAVPEYKPMSRDEVIARNRLGQRVDPPCRDYDKTEVDRIKKLKMCNVHFLRHECPFSNACTHVHAYKPTKDELNTLKLVARMAPCVHGSSCADIKCIYGHRCPAPPSKHHVKGTKSCIFGEQCKFPPELHDIDTNVVKTLVIR